MLTIGPAIRGGREKGSGLGFLLAAVALAFAAGADVPANAQTVSATSRQPVLSSSPPARKPLPSPSPAVRQSGSTVSLPPGFVHSPIREPVTAAACPNEARKPYFVEFRARTAASYGHSFLFFGRLAGPGKFGKFEVTGLHPRGESSATYVTGMMVPVPSETGPSDGDLDEQYLIARYCVVLGEDEYHKMVAYIRKLQASSPIWHATTKNCNGFIGDIARSIGLKAPTSHMLYPEVYVNQMREMNSGGSGFATSLIPYEQWGIQKNR
jgi:hypothetical protein